MKNILWGLLLALQFLTRVPIPVSCPWNNETVKWALRFYPLVGLILGGTLAGLATWISLYIPLWMLTLVLLTVWLGVTGGLHVDGWMDVADALGSNAPLEKKWLIMKDPHVGSFGMVALILLLAWKFALLYALVERVIEAGRPYTTTSLLLLSIMIIPALARYGALCVMFVLPTAKQEGLAWEWKKHLSFKDVFIALVPFSVALLIHPVFIYIYLLFFLFILVYILWVYRTFKGINGDLIGTVIEGGELWGLLITWSCISFVTV